MTGTLAEHYGLRPNHFDFVSKLSATGDIEAASEHSGLSVSSGYRLSREPAIQAAVAAEVRRKLQVGAALGVKVLLELAASKTASERVRADCAKALLDRAGFIAPRAVAPGNGLNKQLHELSTADLRALADKLENEIAGRAKQVNAPHQDDDTVQHVDLVG